ncbi:unnamed protein product [Symbiodinium necroappetens]|uniref:Uncharacterized protein n=1 Tax=Symbiodinium necroappetens TaxID=1628268 RepID=A0A812NKE2_9DINO|nr:unnamed protein product [Symbiodinium necroappetens]
MLGYCLTVVVRKDTPDKDVQMIWAVAISALLDVIALVYYAVSAPWLTTLAHACALGMGALTSFLRPRPTSTRASALLCPASSEHTTGHLGRG